MRKLERHPESRNVFKIILVSLVILMVVAAGVTVYLAFFTGTCRITNVEVTGNTNLPTDYIKKLSGVDYYRNLLTLPVGTLEKNLKKDSWIKSARVSRQLFHTVHIRVTESVPTVMLDCRGAGFLADGGGLVIVGASLADFENLPRVYCGAMRTPTPGEVVKDRKVNGCIRVMADMPVAIRDLLLLANPFDGRGYVFNMRTGFQVIYGPRAGESEKNSVLEAIIADVSNKHRTASYIDVRVPDAPVIKLD